MDGHPLSSFSRDFTQEYEKMVEQLYKSMKKNKELEKKIATLSDELAHYRSMEVISNKIYDFATDFPYDEYKKIMANSCPSVSSFIELEEWALFFSLGTQNDELDKISKLLIVLSAHIDNLVDSLHQEIKSNPILPISHLFPLIQRISNHLFNGKFLCESTYVLGPVSKFVESILNLLHFCHRLLLLSAQDFSATLINFALSNYPFYYSFFFLGVRFLSNIFEPIFKKSIEDYNISEDSSVTPFPAKLSNMEILELLGKIHSNLNTLFMLFSVSLADKKVNVTIEQSVNLVFRLLIRYAVLWPCIKKNLSGFHAVDDLTDQSVIDLLLESYRKSQSKIMFAGMSNYTICIPTISTFFINSVEFPVSFSYSFNQRSYSLALKYGLSLLAKFNNSFSSIISHSIYDIYSKLKLLKLSSNNGDQPHKPHKKVKQKENKMGTEPSLASIVDLNHIQKFESLLNKSMRINMNKMRQLPVDILRVPVHLVIEMIINTFLTSSQQELVDSFEAKRQATTDLIPTALDEDVSASSLISNEGGAIFNAISEFQDDNSPRALLETFSDSIVNYTRSLLEPIADSPKKNIFWMQIVVRLTGLVEANFNETFPGTFTETLFKFLSRPSPQLNTERIVLGLIWLYHEWWVSRQSKITDKDHQSLGLPPDPSSELPNWSSGGRLDYIFKFLISLFTDEVKFALILSDQSDANSEDEIPPNTILESQSIKDKVALLLGTRNTDMIDFPFFLSLSPVADGPVLQDTLSVILSDSLVNNSPSTSLRRLCYVLGVACKLALLRPKARHHIFPFLFQFLSHSHRGTRHFAIHVILEKLLPAYFSVLEQYAYNQLRELSVNSDIMDAFYGYKKETSTSSLEEMGVWNVVELKTDLYFALSVRRPSLLASLYKHWHPFYMEDVEGKKKVSSLRHAIGSILGSEKKEEFIERVLRQFQPAEGDSKCFFGYLINCISSDLDRQNISHRMDKNLISVILELVRKYHLSMAYLLPLIGGLDRDQVFLYLPDLISFCIAASQNRVDEEDADLCHTLQISASLKDMIGAILSPLSLCTIGPSQFLIAVNNVTTTETSSIVYVLKVCIFELKEIFKQEDVMMALQSLFDGVNLPPPSALEMLGFALAVGSNFNQRQVVGFAISYMTRLITRKVWLKTPLWHNFIVLSKKMIPVSLQFVIQLPKEQLAAMIRKEPELGAALREFFKKQPSSFRNRFTWAIDLLSSSKGKAGNKNNKE